MRNTHMDFIRAALLNAKVERLTIDDLMRVAEYATNAQQFDRAVNELVRATNG